MKQNLKITSLVFGMFVWAMSLFAQTNYYTATKTFNENGFTYQCDVTASRSVTLYNKNNKWMYANQVYKNTGTIFIMPEAGVDLWEDDNWTDSKSKSIVNNAFSTAEKQRVKGRNLIISMYINPETGKVDEVDFAFVNFNPYATIPISVYRKIEVELKKDVWFTPTTEGKKLNYILYWWGQEPK